MVKLRLTNAEALYVKDILDLWVEGYMDTKTEIERDPTIESPEEMLGAIYGADKDIQDALTIRERLGRQLEGQRVEG